MTELIIKNFAGEVGLMPIRGVQFYSSVELGYEADANVIIYNLEQESSFKITGLTRPDDRGGMRRIGYKFEASLYLPHNKLNSNGLDIVFGDYLNKGYNMMLILGTASGYSETPHTAPEAINSTHGMKLSISEPERIGHTIDIESVAYRPRIIVRLAGFGKTLQAFNFI